MLVNFSTVSSLLVFAATISAYPVDPSSPTVNLGYTQYQGTNLENGITQWLGMRYAAPPVGSLRFRAPQDPIPNSALQIADTVKLLALCINSRLMDRCAAR